MEREKEDREEGGGGTVCKTDSLYASLKCMGVRNAWARVAGQHLVLVERSRASK